MEVFCARAGMPSGGLRFDGVVDLVVEANRAPMREEHDKKPEGGVGISPLHGVPSPLGGRETPLHSLALHPLLLEATLLGLWSPQSSEKDS